MHWDLRVFRSTCTTFNPLYSTFNVVGLDDDGFLKAILFVNRDHETVVAKRCYEHYWLILCSLFLPPCINGTVVLPCMEMCLDFKRGCNDSAFAIECNSLAHAHTNTCINAHVNCGEPPEVPSNSKQTFQNGSSLGSIVTFQCEDGYEAHGNSFYVCDYSGFWKVDERFQCRKKPEAPPVVLIVGISTGILVLLVAIATFCVIYFKLEILLLRKKYFKQQTCCNTKKKQGNEDKLYDAFIAYHLDDCHPCEDFVRNELHEQLESKGLRIYTDYSAADLGSCMVRRIPDVIAQSSSVILVLNQHFLDSSWGAYELDQSFHQLIEDRTLDLILIITDDPKQLMNVPRFLKAYLRTKSYFKGSDKNLIDKITRLLPANDGNLNGTRMEGFQRGSSLSLTTLQIDVGSNPCYEPEI